MTSFFFISCDNNDSSELEYHGAVRINKQEAKLGIGEKLNLKFSFLSQVIDKENIKWISENTAIASIDVNTDKTCIVNGLAEGTSKI